MTLPPPEPQFRKLIAVVQNATGLVATGEASPVDAIATLWRRTDADDGQIECRHGSVSMSAPAINWPH